MFKLTERELLDRRTYFWRFSGTFALAGALIVFVMSDYFCIEDELTWVRKLMGLTIVIVGSVVLPIRYLRTAKTLILRCRELEEKTRSGSDPGANCKSRQD